MAEVAEKGDVSITITDEKGLQKTTVLKGANSLEGEARHMAPVLLHHAGDILHKSTDPGGMNLGSIVGTIAWVTKNTLEQGSATLSTSDANKLKASLKLLGVTVDEAARLAKKPIIVGLIFNERKHDAEDASDMDEDESVTNTDGLVIQQATEKQARAQRAAARAAATALLQQEDGQGGAG
jgi:hypothetical protein